MGGGCWRRRNWRVELAEEAQEVAETVTVERVEVATLEGGGRLGAPSGARGGYWGGGGAGVVGTATGLLEEGRRWRRRRWWWDRRRRDWRGGRWRYEWRRQRWRPPVGRKELAMVEET